MKLVSINLLAPLIIWSGIYAFPYAADAQPKDLLPENKGLEDGKFGHWGAKTDKDWLDDRLSKMNYGSLISHIWDTPGGRAEKGMCVAIGSVGWDNIIFDSKTASALAGWAWDFDVEKQQAKFIQFDPARFGLIGRHKVIGRWQWSLPKGATSWQGAKEIQYRGLYTHHSENDRYHATTFHYEVDGIDILDSFNCFEWLGDTDGGHVYIRCLELKPVERGPSREGRELTLVLADTKPHVAIAPGASKGVKLEKTKDAWLLRLPASKESQRVTVGMTDHHDANDLRQTMEKLDPSWRADFKKITQPGSLRWGKPIEVAGTLGNNKLAYTIDTIPVPFDNKHKALMYLSGIDFFDNGDAAVCTAHGDVWLVRGLDETLKKVTWQRFATGLFQPLGLRVRKNQVYILGRDQITLLHDRNSDGEADYYECFTNLIDTSPGGHDYVTCLEVDREGNFYYIDYRGLHRISSDGKKKETLATGWRNPNGMSVGPDGTITAAPQEGEWTPASMIDEIAPGRKGFYGGYVGPKVTKNRPLGYDTHLVYLPRTVDNSTGSQVWVPAESDRFGPLKGQLLNLSFGQCAMQLILREHVQGVAQGAVVPLPGRFQSGIMRGSFNPRDGQLYVVGMNGWVTSAVRDGCLQRVRYTGAKLNLPVAFSTHADGIKLTFSEPLDQATAEDLGSYALEQWNYKYSKDYGSKEYSVRHPEAIGHDKVEPIAAKLLADGRSVFLRIADLAPVHQLQVRYNVESKQGAEIRGALWMTINRLGAHDP